MALDSVSFRITRNTEDLAQTIHALSQRLVVMEQRLQAMELQLNTRQQQDREPDRREMSSLDNVERLLFDCRALLGLEETEQHEDSEEFSDLPASAAVESGCPADRDLFTPPVPFQQAA